MGSYEKILFADEISFSRCPGDGKIRAAKIGGIGMIPNGFPAFRKGTQATWNKIRWIQKDWPSGITEVRIHPHAQIFSQLQGGKGESSWFAGGQAAMGN
jgi:hypothetical protein